ncbi:MAG: hypothetical protein WC444_00310 [Candidatus Paceibacterota bacterium]
MSNWVKNLQIALVIFIGSVGTLATIAIYVKGPNPEVVQQQIKTEERKIQEEKTKQIALQNPGSSIGLFGAKGAPLPDRQEPVVATAATQPAKPATTTFSPVNGSIVQFPCNNAEETRIGFLNTPVKYLEGGRTLEFNETGCSHVQVTGVAAYAAHNYHIFVVDDPQNSCGDIFPGEQNCQMEWFEQAAGKGLGVKVVNGFFRVITR